MQPKHISVKDLKNTKWDYSIERQINLLCMSLRTEGMKSFFYNKALGKSIDISGHTNINGRIYDPKEVIGKTRKAIKKLVKEKGYSVLQKMANSCYNVAEELHQFLRKPGENCLYKKFLKFTKLYPKLAPYLGIVRFSEKILDEELEKLIRSKVSNEEAFSSYFENLSFISKEVDSTKELKDLLKIAEIIKKERVDYNSLRLEKLIEKHLKKWEHMKIRWNFEEPYMIEDIKKRLKKYTKEDPNQEIQKMRAVSEKANKITKEFIEKYKLKHEEIELINTVKEFVYLRTFRTDAFFKAHYFLKPLLKEIVRVVGIDFKDLLYLRFNEILELLKEDKINHFKELIKERKQGWYLVMYNDQERIFSGNDITLVDDIKLFEKRRDKVDEVKGNVACQGVIKGKVKVVKNANDCEKVKSGDILVAVMTFPQYIVAMERAAAFVTDEGGILCHAAIIAREMQKPCITGTEISTQIFRDGDLVEVDTKNGIVRKVNQ